MKSHQRVQTDSLVDRELADSQWEKTQARQSPHANAPASAGLDLGLAAARQGSGSAGAMIATCSGPVDASYTEARAGVSAPKLKSRDAHRQIRGTMVLRRTSTAPCSNHA